MGELGSRSRGRHASKTARVEVGGEVGRVGGRPACDPVAATLSGGIWGGDRVRLPAVGARRGRRVGDVVDARRQSPDVAEADQRAEGDRFPVGGDVDLRVVAGVTSPPFLSGGETISQARLSGRKPWPGNDSAAPTEGAPLPMKAARPRTQRQARPKTAAGAGRSRARLRSRGGRGASERCLRSASHVALSLSLEPLPAASLGGPCLGSVSLWCCPCPSETSVARL